MATVTQKPDTLSFLRNLKPFIINTSESVVFKLTAGGATVIEETYYPDGTDYVTIDVQEVCSQYLSLELPTGDIFTQPSARAVFSSYLNGSLITNIVVIAGGVRKLSDTAANWMKANWLTWQPQTKCVRWYQPEHLTYYHQEQGSVMARFYPLTGSPETVAIYTGDAADVNTYNMEMAHLFSFSSHDAAELNGYVDVWVADADGTRLSYIQRYVLVPTERTEHYYLAVNSLGGIDTFCFTGARTLAPSISHESAMLADVKVNITDSPERAWQQGTGSFSKTESRWLWEFFAGARQWAIIDDNIEEIVLNTSSIKASDRANLNTSEFSFTLAEDGQLLKISRSADELPPIEVQSPGGELFFLAPRVVDYPDANLQDDLLFLVQTPYVQEWKKVSLATLKQWVQTIFTSYEDDLWDILAADGAQQIAASHLTTALSGYATESWVEGKGYLTEHQPLHDLTIKGLDSIGTYNPSASKTITITPALIGAAASSHTHIPNDINGLEDTIKSYIEANWFVKDSAGNIRPTSDTAGLYSMSFVSARGSDDSASGGGSGLDESALWDILGSVDATKKIDKSHLPEGLLEDLCTLTITGATGSIVYDPTAEDKSITLNAAFVGAAASSHTHVPNDINGLEDTIKSYIETNWFVKDSEGNIRPTSDTAGLYSMSFVSARGSDDSASGGGSGLDESALWDILGSVDATKKIDKSHLPEGLLEDLCTLTITGATGSIVYDPTAEDKSITLNAAFVGAAASSHTHIPNDINGLEDTIKSYIEANWFVKDSAGNIRPTSDTAGLYSMSFVSARGSDDSAAGSGSGLDESALWDILTNGAGGTIIDKSHIPDLSESYLTSVSLSTISDLHASWDALLGAAPTAYITRWPSVSEVTGKQNLIIKLNSGIVEGTSLFTYNGEVGKIVNITPSGIGAAASSHSHTVADVTGLQATLTSLGNADVKSVALSTTALTVTKNDNTTLTASVPTWNQDTTGTAANASSLGGVAASGYVTIAGAQTITGAKTFNAKITGYGGMLVKGDFKAVNASGWGSLQLTKGKIFLSPGGDATLSMYPLSNGTYGDETIALQSAFDGVDGQTHGYVDSYPNRCIITLQPRGGRVGIGIDYPTHGFHVVPESYFASTLTTQGLLSANGGVTTTTLSASGNASVGGTLGVTGAATFSSLLTANAGITISNGTQSATLKVDSDGNLYVDKGFYSNSFVSARGSDDAAMGGSTGLDESAMWAALGNTGTQQIDASHLTTALDGYALSSEIPSVSVSQTLTSGTEVGKVTVNGTVTTLYAPTNTDTHYTTHLYATSSTGTGNAATTNGNTYLRLFDDTTARASIRLAGSGATSVTSDASGNITISSVNSTYTLAGLGGVGSVSASGTSPLNLSASKSGTAVTITGSLSIVNGAAVTHTNYPTNGGYLPNMNFLSSWNGAYSSAGASNLTYCNRGAFGTIVTKSSGDYALASHTHSYLPLSGGTMTGDIAIPIVRSHVDGSVPYAGSGMAADGTTVPLTSLAYYKTYLGSYLNENNEWYNIISIRHRNGASDGNNYGMYLRTSLLAQGNLSWGKQIYTNSWQAERVLLDSANYTSYAPTKTGSGASGTWGINISGTAANASQLGGLTLQQVRMQRSAYSGKASSGAGWYRIYTFSGLTSYNTQVVIQMSWIYYNSNNSPLTIWVNPNYTRGGIMTYCSNISAVTKVRVVQNSDSAGNESNCYVDVYIADSFGNNIYYVTGTGYGTFQAPAIVTAGVGRNMCEVTIAKGLTVGGMDCNGVANGITVSGAITGSSRAIISHTASNFDYFTASTGTKNLLRLRAYSEADYGLATSDNWLINTEGTHTYLQLGNTLIGPRNTTVPAYRLHVLGVAYATTGIFSDGYVSARGVDSSDANLKKNIRDYDALSLLKLLKPRAFEWNDTAKKLSSAFASDDTQYGLVAQEVEQVMPSIVKDNMFGDGYKGVIYQKLTPLLLGGLLQLVAHEETQDEKIERLERRVSYLETELENYKRLNA